MFKLHKFLIFFSTDADDEFISDAFQASSKDLDEVNENMKRLGVKSKFQISFFTFPPAGPAPPHFENIPYLLSQVILRR